MSLPSVLIAASQSRASYLISEITNCEEYKSGSEGNLHMHRWHINNKYYDADVNLCYVDDLAADIGEEFYESIEAFILFPDQHGKITDFKDWEKILLKINSEVSIFLIDDLNSQTYPEEYVSHWCLKNHFELIDLNTQKSSDESCSVVVEQFGIARVIEVLHSHTWSNLRIKNEKSHSVSNEEDFSLSPENDVENMMQFCDLFSQLNATREISGNMPACERKLHAEQLVTAFWKAIGGNSDELE